MRFKNERAQLVGKWLHHVNEDDETFITGEIVSVHSEHYAEVRRVHLDDTPDDGEPPCTVLIALCEFAVTGRLFNSEEDARAWWAWLFRPETIKEARKRLRPGS